MSASPSIRTSPTRTLRFRTSRRQRVRRASRAIPRRAPLLTYMSIKSRVQGFALKLVGKPLVGKKGHEGLDTVGTVHFSDWVPFENNHLGFFTIFDGDFREVHPGLRRGDLGRLRCCLSTCRWRAANPGREERPGVLSVGIGKQPSAHRVLQRLSRPRGSRRQSPAGRLSQATIGDRWIARGSHGHEP